MSVSFLIGFALEARCEFDLFRRVKTLANAAIIVVVLGAAAVSTIPTTTANVVFIVARFVALPGSFVTFFTAWHSLVVFIPAGAVDTVEERRLGSTTVPAVPIAAADIVFVVAVAISAPSEHFAFTVALVGHRRVEALAFLAVGVLVLRSFLGVSTAVPAVPVATTDVVVVVAMAIALPLMHSTISFALSVFVNKRLVEA